MRRLFLCTFLIGSLLASSGCQRPYQGNLPDSAFRQGAIPVKQNDANNSIEEIEEPTGVISLDDALDASFKMHPGLAALEHNVKAFNGTIRQAGTLPNPSLSGEIEELAGSGEFSGTGVVSSRLGISQEIPIGGQPSKRIKVARIEKSIAESEYSALVLELRSEIKKRFLRVYVLQEQLKLEEKNLSILSSLNEAVAKRVFAGEAPPLDEVKVKVQFESAEITLERTKRELEGAKHRLAALWGKEVPGFEKVIYDFENDLTIPDEQNLIDRARFSPIYSILNKNVALASSKIDLARVESWLDIEVGGGVQHFNETDDHAYFLEVSIPLPIFNRNRGNIEEAIQMRNMAQKELEAGMLEFRSGLRDLAKKAQSVQMAYLSMEKSVMPAAEKAFNAVKKSYTSGEGSYLELLEAQRTYLDARKEHLELLNEFHELKIEMESLIDEVNKEK